jgi:hypothetical protein
MMNGRVWDIICLMLIARFACITVYTRVSVFLSGFTLLHF